MTTSNRRVVVCLDGSAGSDHAWNYAVNNIIRPDDHVTLCAVAIPEYESGDITGDVSEATGMMPDEGAMERAMIEAHQQMQSALLKYLGTVDNKFEADAKILPREESIGGTIVKFIKSHGATEVVIGNRGLGAIQRTLMNLTGLGSVSDYVVHHSPCPVVVVRPEQSARGPSS